MMQRMKKYGKAVLEKLFGIYKKLSRRPMLLTVALIALVLGLTVLWSTNNLQTKSGITTFGLKDIGELATQSGYFTVVNVIDDNVELWGWDVPLTKSKYIFSYDGTIKAGFDFTQMEYQVDESKKEILVVLPKVKILSVEIQEDSLEIYDESHNIFTPLGLSDIQEARLTMVEEIQNRALENGLLEQATTNAQRLISGFLSGLYDLNEYHVVFNGENVSNVSDD